MAIADVYEKGKNFRNEQGAGRSREASRAAKTTNDMPMFMRGAMY